MPHAGYNTSYMRAVETLQNAVAPAELAGRCGAEYTPDRFELAYFGKRCAVTLPGCDFSLPDLSLGEKILILHYLISQGPVEENPPQATFESLRGGMFYFQTFKKRGPDRVLADFGNKPQALRRIAAYCGWAESSTGEFSIIIPALPLIDLTVAFYAGDDEFPPEVKFLFRRDITSFLPLEDVAALGGFVATRLGILKRSLEDAGA